MITNKMLGQHGQLGNQLFQHAALLGIAAVRGYDVAIPWNPIAGKQQGQTELHHFQVTTPHLKPEDAEKITRRYWEPHYHYDYNVFLQPDGTSFEGRFQSEKYFQHIAHHVRREYRLQLDYTDWARGEEYRILQEFPKHALVSVNVRRGDNVTAPRHFRVLSPSYYKRTCDIVRKWVGGPCRFLIFSDEPDWCESEMDLTDAVVIRSPGYLHDLALMINCDHHILAVGTFSWWGAWLGQKLGQLVLAPYPWFRQREDGTQDNTEDVYARGWKRVSIGPRDLLK